MVKNVKAAVHRLARMSVPFKDSITGEERKQVIFARDLRSFLESANKDVYLSVVSRRNHFYAEALLACMKTGRSWEILYQEYRCDGSRTA